MKIAVIEDSKKIGYIIFKTFERENIDVKIFETLKESKRIQPGTFAAYIVDYNLQDGYGIEFIKYIREEKADTAPILMLTVRDSLEDKLTGFNAGADDYMTKPFELAELVVRIKSLIKRASSPGPKGKVVEINGIEINFESMEVKYKGKKIDFSKKEYQLITYLANNRGQTISKEKILDNLWIDSTEKDANIVNVYINRIRDRLKNAGAPNLITTFRGFGYTIK